MLLSVEGDSGFIKVLTWLITLKTEKMLRDF